MCVMVTGSLQWWTLLNARLFNAFQEVASYSCRCLPEELCLGPVTYEKCRWDMAHASTVVSLYWNNRYISVLLHISSCETQYLNGNHICLCEGCLNIMFVFILDSKMNLDDFISMDSKVGCGHVYSLSEFVKHFAEKWLLGLKLIYFRLVTCWIFSAFLSSRLQGHNPGNNHSQC
jgi:hypothetical protein